MIMMVNPILFLTFLLLIPTSQAYDFYFNCSGSPTYTPNSTYETNLNSLLTNLTTQSNFNGFFETSIGQNPDKTYGQYLCRGDMDSLGCSQCVYKARTDILMSCPSQIYAVIWLDDCMLRFSNASFFNRLDLSPNTFAYDPKNITNDEAQAIADVLNKTMTGFAPVVANSRMKYATKESNTSQQMYVLGQCTPDLTADDCDRCLRSAIVQLPPSRIGGQFMQPSCNVRFDVSPFYVDYANVSFFFPPPMNSTVRTANGLVAAAPAGKGLYIALAIVSLTAAISLLLNVVTYLKRNKIGGKPTGIEEIETMESLHFEFNAIRLATDNFSAANKLGQGGFGIVYLGTLADGQAVAVKRLSNTSGQGIREFKTEACLAAKLQHKNLVKLFGFCLERDEMLLVYEFVPNKSLDRYLFDPKASAYLKWGTRYKIIVGIARGLLYLHEDSRPKIIHRDLKPSNILLDGEMSSKIADFGMAKLFGGDQTQGNTSRVAGTFGYMAPEYTATGQFSVRSDIFSYGVILLEIVSGSRNLSIDLEIQDENLLNHAWRHWNEGNYLKLLDPALGNDFSKDEAERCIHVGLLCIQENPTKRPDIASVLSMLSTKPISLPLPELPPPFPYRLENNAVSHESHSSVQADNLITELTPR